MNIPELANELNNILTEPLYIYESKEYNPTEDADIGAVIYLNTKKCHDKGYLTDRYHEEHDSVADLLNLGQVMESTYESYEDHDKFMNTLRQLSDMVSNLIFTDAPFKA